MWLNIRLKVRDFWKRHKYKVILGILIWIIVIIVNDALKSGKVAVTPSISYAPHESIMDSQTEVSESLAKSVEKWTDSFYEACNNKEYETAYNMLSDSYKRHHSKEEYRLYFQRKENIYFAELC